MNILYIISAPKEQFEKHYKPEAGKVDVLVKRGNHSDWIRECSNKGLGEIFTYNSARISPFDSLLIKKLRKKQYDEIIFFYNNPERLGYLQIELFTLLLKAGKRKGIFETGIERAINWPVFVLDAFINGVCCSVDFLGSLVLMLFLMPCLFIYNVFIKTLYKPVNKSILFVGMGGEYSASFRVRCRNFSGELAKKGYKTKAVGFYDLHDKYIKNSPYILLKLCDIRKIIMLMIMYYRIAWKYRKYKILYCQKVDYPTIAAYLSCLLTQKKFILDYDDWDRANFPEFFKRVTIIPFFRFSNLTDFFIKKSSLCIVASRHLENIFKRKISRKRKCSAW